MSDKKQGIWNPIFHEYDYPEDQNPPLPSADEICPQGGVHDDYEVNRSNVYPDGDPAWIRYCCKKCGRVDIQN